MTSGGRNLPSTNRNEQGVTEYANFICGHCDPGQRMRESPSPYRKEGGENA
jgi:hypothetical protein